VTESPYRHPAGCFLAAQHFARINPQKKPSHPIRKKALTRPSLLTVAVRSIRLIYDLSCRFSLRFILPVGPVRHRCGLASVIKPRGPHRGGSFRPPKVQQRCGETMARTTKVPLGWSHVLTLVDLTRPRPLRLGHVNFRSPPCWGSVVAAFIERVAEAVLVLAPSQKRAFGSTRAALLCRRLQNRWWYVERRSWLVSCGARPPLE